MVGFRAHGRGTSELVIRKASLGEEGLDELMLVGMRTFPASARAVWCCPSKRQMHTQLRAVIIQTNPTNKLTPMRDGGCTKILGSNVGTAKDWKQFSCPGV